MSLFFRAIPCVFASLLLVRPMFKKGTVVIFDPGGKCDMKNYLNGYWQRLASSSLCELVELFGDKIVWPEGVSAYGTRSRIFTPWRTFWLFIGQVLSHSQSCVEALRKAQGWLWIKKKGLLQHGGIL